MGREPEIGSSADAAFDAHATVLGAADNVAPRSSAPAESNAMWSGDVQGDGSGPQRSYFVRLYADGTAHCQCPDFYFRSTLRRDASYTCKHVKRALSALRVS